MRYSKSKEAPYRGRQLTLKHCIKDLQNAFRACRINGMDTKEHKKRSNHDATTSSYQSFEPKNKKLAKLNAKLGSRVFQLRPGQTFEVKKATASNPNAASSQKKRMLRSTRERESLMLFHSREERLVHPIPRPVLTLKTGGHASNKSQKNFSEDAQTHSYGAEHSNIVDIRENQEDRTENCRELRILANVKLNYFHEHPMLQQELVAEIDGRNIRFQLVEVDPELLLQEHPTFMSEPLPSLIWPYD